MSYTVLKDGKAHVEEITSLYALLNKFNDMYKYSVIIGGNLVYVVIKNDQPKYWEHGWAE